MDPDDIKLKRDFAHTVLVISARALAENEFRKARPSTHGFTRCFEITLLAAAAGEALVLPGTEISAQGGDLGISFEEREDGLRVTLQIYGFAALRSHGGQEARLVRSNGAIEYAFRFSQQGTALCILADTPEVRAGLANCAVFVADV